MVSTVLHCSGLVNLRPLSQGTFPSTILSWKDHFSGNYLLHINRAELINPRLSAPLKITICLALGHGSRLNILLIQCEFLHMFRYMSIPYSVIRFFPALFWFSITRNKCWNNRCLILSSYPSWNPGLLSFPLWHRNDSCDNMYLSIIHGPMAALRVQMKCTE